MSITLKRAVFFTWLALSFAYSGQVWAQSPIGQSQSEQLVEDSETARLCDLERMIDEGENPEHDEYEWGIDPCVSEDISKKYQLPEPTVLGADKEQASKIKVKIIKN